MIVLRRVAALSLALVSVAALVGVARLVAPATAATGEPPGVARQLTFLRTALDDGAGDAAQALFPEGFFFAHALYGLARVELGLRTPARREESLREARWALGRLESPTGRAPFDPELTPPYGVFHQGWTNWLRGGVLALQPVDRRDPAEVRRFTDASAALGAAFDGSASPYLPAYPGQAWPVDSTVAVASLRLHDALLPARFGGTVDRWRDGVRQRLDPGTGLLPHRVDPVTGAPVEGARGTSQSVIHRFLVEIDPVFARQQYLEFRQRFVTTPLGLGPAVREYPDGSSGPGDVDSGPLLLGVSLSATVVTLGAAQVQGDRRLAGALANYGELAGLPVGTPWTKRYALGLLPVGDAFLAWAKTARPWLATLPGGPDPLPAPASVVSSWWRAPLLLLLATVAVLPWVPALVARRSRRPPIGPGAPAAPGPAAAPGAPGATSVRLP